MHDADRDLLAQLEQSERERLLAASPPPRNEFNPETIHYTELPEDTAGGPLATEWNVYRREVARLLAEGNENRWVLIRDETVVGIWDTEAEARTAAAKQFLMQPVLIRQVRFRETVLPTPTFLYRCRS
jgi:hypothetical protein